MDPARLVYPIIVEKQRSPQPTYHEHQIMQTLPQTQILVGQGLSSGIGRKLGQRKSTFDHGAANIR